MAEGIRYVCAHCGKAIKAWSDGNPYYLDAGGGSTMPITPTTSGWTSASAMTRRICV